MPIVSCKGTDNKKYTFVVASPDGITVEEVGVTSNGIYTVYYMQNGRSVSVSGSIKDVYISDKVSNGCFPSTLRTFDNNDFRVSHKNPPSKKIILYRKK